MHLLEREIFKCPIIAKEEINKYYPELSEDSLYLMSLQYVTDKKKVHVFGFTRMNSKGEQYVEIDFYNELHFCPNRYRRFIIQKDYMMEENEEKAFLNLCHLKNLVIDSADFVTLQEGIARYCPDMKIRTYSLCEIGEYLVRLYHSTHRGGAREIMYKSGLRIAETLDSIDEYDLLGNTPEEIIGVPIKLVRLLENAGLEKLILEEKSRNRAKEVYIKYSDYIGKNDLPNRYQWFYLEGLNGEPVNKPLFRRLKECESYDKYIYFKRYMELLPVVGDYNPYSRIPRANKIVTATLKLSDIARYIEDMDVKDKLLRKNNDKGYDFSDEVFFTVAPLSVKEFIEEAHNQENCLLSYINRVAAGETTILFVRRKEAPNKSYLTLEICKGALNQVKARYNAAPDTDGQAFVEKFAAKYGLKYVDRRA